MRFEQNQTLHLPELAAHLGLTSPAFKVDYIVSGGMGECIRTTQNQQSFALKVIQNDLIEESDAWNRYLREVRLWTTLSACDGVVEAFCIIRVNELPVVCTRWMAGGSLRRHLRNRSPEFFFSVMARIVGTLRWAYAQHKVLHRDLKPDNILMDEAGLAFVSDWGLALPLADKPEHRHATVLPDTPPALTAAGRILGTVYYASPEQLLGDDSLDLRADIYSLGCLMYEWEKGICPFTGTTVEEVRLKHLFQPPPRVRTFLRQSAFGADDAILACLQKDREKRLPDYAALELALAASARDRGIQYAIFRPALRYGMPMVGTGRYRHQFQPGQTGLWNKAGTYALVERSETEQHLREAQVLSAVGDYSKALEIYGSLFVPEAVSAVPNYPFNQHIAINYAVCLIALGRADDAITALHCIATAKEKPSEYFVNLSLAQIKRFDHPASAATASEGLQFYPGDQDLIGNLLTAQTAMGAFSKAADTANARLAVTRNVHSLHEVAALHCRYADSVRDVDWPLAVHNLKYAVSLLREAKALNPRFLPVRLQLPIALERLTAYTQCSDEVGYTKDLALHVSDGVLLTYLIARCLDRTGAHKECWEFCNRWLRKIAELESRHPALRRNIVMLERVRAVTIADGYCIGMMKDGQRVIAPEACEFFANIVRDVDLREACDFCYLARLHEWMEEYDEAYAVLTQGELLYPNYWENPFNRAAFRVRAGDYLGALSSAELAAQLAPWKVQSWRLLAKTLGAIGKATEAESASSRADEVQRARDELADEIEKAVNHAGPHSE